MAQPNPKESRIEQVLQLVEQLPPDEQIELWRKLDIKTWGKRWDELVKRIQERRRNLPPLTDEEIVAEMKSIRREVWAERAEGDN
jgi:hypothetical protein